MTIFTGRQCCFPGTRVPPKNLSCEQSRQIRIRVACACLCNVVVQHFLIETCILACVSDMFQSGWYGRKHLHVWLRTSHIQQCLLPSRSNSVVTHLLAASIRVSTSHLWEFLSFLLPSLKFKIPRTSLRTLPVPRLHNLRHQTHVLQLQIVSPAASHVPISLPFVSFGFCEATAIPP